MEKQADQKRLSIFCKRTGKLLFRVDSDALYVWCRGNHAEEAIPWDAIGKIVSGEQVAEVTVQPER